MGPRHPKLATGYSKTDPRWLQVGPKMALDGPKMAHAGPKMAQGSIGWLKMSPRQPKLATR